MIACRLDLLGCQCQWIPCCSVLRPAAPSLGVGSLVTAAASPATTHGLELAVLERAIEVTLLTGGKRDVATWCFVARLQVNECCWAPMPVDGGMRTWMVPWMPVTHVGVSDGQSLMADDMSRVELSHHE